MSNQTNNTNQPKRLMKLSRSEKVQLKKLEDNLLAKQMDLKYDLNTIMNKNEQGTESHETYAFENVNFGINGKELIRNSSFSIEIGRKYGFFGQNGTGKTLLLKAIAYGKIKLPDHLKIHLVEEELIGDDTTIVQCFANTKAEQVALIDEIKEMESKPVSRKKDIYQPSQRVVIIKSLGFDSSVMETMACDLSGGWRMRISLACALISEPDILLLDEPSNMLDSKTVSWLLAHLKNWKKGLIFSSHDKSFMNNITTDVLHITDKKITHHKFSYRDFEKLNREEFLMDKSKYMSNENKKKELNDFIKNKKSNKKAVVKKKDELKNLPDLKEPKEIKKESWRIAACQKIKCSTISAVNMGFSYKPTSRLIVKDINVDVKPDSKICLLGHNGCGKSTLLQLFLKKLKNTQGDVFLNDRTNVGYFCQHTLEGLIERKSDEELFEEFKKMSIENEVEKEEMKKEITSIDFLMSQNANAADKYCSLVLKEYGVVEEDHNIPLRCLSSGQRSRVVFASISMKKPNFLILDEPTNHLDMEGISALEDAIKNFKGGVILVTHDGRMMGDMCTELWYLTDGRLTVEDNRDIV